ncbi:MAG: hypothetical protein HY695_12475 [Deltaproteobacteria bacterium]|nr:hypothetical protein [Deltaproteobacteria bacterium]
MRKLFLLLLVISSSLACQNVTDTFVYRASTDTLTNKTFDTAGTSNVTGTGILDITKSPYNCLDGRDCTTGIRQALSDCVNGGAIYIPPVTTGFILSGSGVDRGDGTMTLLLSTKQCSILGSNGTKSRLVVASSVANTVDVLTISPAVGAAYQELTLKDFAIVEQSGNPGRDAIVVYMPGASQLVQYMHTIGVRTGYGLTGRSFRAVNPTKNPDALVLSQWVRNVFPGGIKTDIISDSGIIDGNVFPVGGPNNVAIDLNIYHGSSSWMISNNNATMNGGFLRLRGGQQVNLVNNQVELLNAINTTEQPSSGLIVFEGSSSTIHGGRVMGGNISTNANAANGIVIDRASGIIIDGVQIGKGSKNHIYLTSSSSNACIRQNNYDVSAVILDQGTNNRIAGTGLGC